MDTTTYREVQRSLRRLLAALVDRAPNPREFIGQPAGSWQKAHDAWAVRARAVEAEYQANGYLQYPMDFNAARRPR
jgi:hypothetical protein